MQLAIDSKPENLPKTVLLRLTYYYLELQLLLLLQHQLLLLHQIAATSLRYCLRLHLLKSRY
jgi:hypothetical protein